MLSALKLRDHLRSPMSLGAFGESSSRAHLSTPLFPSRMNRVGQNHGGTPHYLPNKVARIIPPPVPLPSPYLKFDLTMTLIAAKKDAEVVIAGAGPVGLIIALMIAQQGIKVVLCEA